MYLKEIIDELDGFGVVLVDDDEVKARLSEIGHDYEQYVPTPDEIPAD